MTNEEFTVLALSFPATEQKPHFDRTAFKVIGKRIFTTLHEASNSANVKLSPSEQKAFTRYSPDVVYPVDNKWGLQGWTTLELQNAKEELVKALLESAYEDVVNRKNSK
ncbi:MmcQ/YjbR family DNA-binding protein [Echinicola sp. CAU 1574]|uniref:MmcQ/YjbR family DNA-binding protein n=1 Tax=Echinicola arenosa TaxID=2774144 RepID=A0ABR9AR83_9BACT|nr:MmcQ/YjbR family DNA-binding protein [Echinicola arenosa]MBD8491295.1 MmcQ/YjbR family DNA-binding protein [Echinicola arenosa]